MTIAIVFVVGDVEVLATPTGCRFNHYLHDFNHHFPYCLRCQCQYKLLSPDICFRPRWRTSLFFAQQTHPSERHYTHLDHWLYCCPYPTQVYGCLPEYPDNLHGRTISSYILCILARFCNRNFGHSPYSNLSYPTPLYLGHTLGNAFNVVAIMFLTCFLVAACFPTAPNPTPDTMAWASAVPGGTVIIALVAYMF